MAVRRSENPHGSSISGFGNISIPGNRVGAVLSFVMVVTAWVAVPLARVFILGTVVTGLLVGGLLCWKHSK